MERNNNVRPSLGRNTNQPPAEYDNDPVHRSAGARHQEKPVKKWPKYLVFLAGIVLVGCAVLWFFGSKNSIASEVDGSKYQAVFLATGEVYFGKLTILPDGYYKMKDVYYIQKKATESTDDGQVAAQSNNMELIKLGNELHSPTDSMFFNRDQVLYFENLKSDSDFMKKIDEAKRQN